MPLGPLRVLLADDEQIVHDTLSGYLRDAGHCVEDVHDGQAALDRMREADFDLALVDVRMPGIDGMALLEQAQDIAPDLPVVIITGHGSMDLVVQALRLGAADFLNKPVKLRELDAVLEKARRVHELLHDRRHLRDVVRGLQTSARQRDRNRGFVGRSAAARAVLEQVRQAVDSHCPTILVTGETGTGKEVIAREIHEQAGTPDAAFIAVNCPAIPAELLESELFGHVKGAFTGATADRAGYFEMADGGTLFLDEIGDLSAAAQAKLLRVLETRTLRRVGGAKEIRVDVRVVAATNVDLQQRVTEHTFRADLFYRLNVFPIDIPPLRERPADIQPLAEHFLKSYASTRGLQPAELSGSAAAALAAYSFPGNARELRNIVERAAILSRGSSVEVAHLALPAAQPAQPITAAVPVRPRGDDAERSQILAALEEARWNRRAAAKALGIPYSTLRHKILRLGLG